MLKKGEREYNLKVLMLGWEFPPFFAGGAGIVCSELSKALITKGTDILFVMPSGPDNTSSAENQNLKIIVTNNKYTTVKIRIKKIDSLLHAYATPQSYNQQYTQMINGTKQGQTKTLYGPNLKEEVYRFAEQVKLLAEEEDFDIIHAHDWVTFPAAIALKQITGKPLVVHIHITEFDKTGGKHADPDIYSIEQEGMLRANKVITVSNKIKDTCIHNYFIDPSKILVVHNAAPSMYDSPTSINNKLKENNKIVLFAGRVTLQKGPDYFVDAAKKVLEKAPDTLFVLAGAGDMLNQMIEKVARLGISNKFIFTGFYTRDQANQLFEIADVFVMPSVSEPFGLVPYEAQLKRTPTIISKQSGIGEVLYHTLKVDFWDVNQLANKILAVLHYKQLHNELKEKGYHEAKSSTWDNPATKCLNIYHHLMNNRGVI